HRRRCARNAGRSGGDRALHHGRRARQSGGRCRVHGLDRTAAWQARRDREGARHQARRGLRLSGEASAVSVYATWAAMLLVPPRRVRYAGTTTNHTSIKSHEHREAAAMADELKIKVNGREVSVGASPDTPLLYVLMNELSLRG